MTSTSAANEDAELSDRLAFMGLDAAAMQALRALRPVLVREIPRALDKFYARAQAHPATGGFLDAAKSERAKAAQIKHWTWLAEGEMDGRLMATARRVGNTHARIGLPPKWYAAGYAVILEHLLSTVVTEAWAKVGFLGGGAAKGVQVAASVAALARVVLLDFELATSAYLDALDERRHEAERGAEQVARDTADAIAAIRRAVAQLAEKKLDAHIDGKLADSFQQMVQDFNAAVDGLRVTLTGVSASLGALTSATQEIASASQDLSGRTEREAASLEQTAAALDELTGQVSKTAERAEGAQAIVNAAGAEAQDSNDVVAKAIGAMGRIEKSSNDIGKIIGAIDEIAFQTNLLALNAGVEAARAGDAGKGFAVVASEVRGLAQRSAEAAKEIKSLVAAATAEVAGGVDLVSATGQSLARIGAKVAEMSAVVGEIHQSARTQSNSLSEIRQAMNDLSGVTQQNAAMAEESTAASQSLARETEKLAQLVNQFDIGASAPPPRPTRAPEKAPREAPRRAAAGKGSWREF